MQDWQRRVIDERADLDAKVGRLETFIGSDKVLTLDQADRDLLERQMLTMLRYSAVLQQRIERF